MRISYLKKSFQILFIVFLLLFYFFNSASIGNFIKEGMLICYTTVIPSLFIFMVIATFLPNLKYSNLLSKPLQPIFRLLKITDKKIVSYCFFGLLSGFATGGYFLNRINDEYECDENFLGVIAIIVSNNSPAFIVSAVGANMIGNVKTGIILYMSIIISSIITAFIFSFIFSYNIPKFRINKQYHKTGIAYAINSSVMAILNICGIVVFTFSLCKAISLYIQNPYILSIISSSLEVTCGCKIIIENFGKNLFLLCIALSFCPLSTCLQLHCKEKSYKILKMLLLSKLITIPVSVLLLRININLFPYSIATYASGNITTSIYWNKPHISCFFLIISICFVIMFDKKVGVFTNYNK